MFLLLTTILTVVTHHYTQGTCVLPRLPRGTHIVRIRNVQVIREHGVGVQTNTAHIDGTILDLGCGVGFVTYGNDRSIRCVNGTWTTTDLQCEVRKCAPLPEITNGRVTYGNNRTYGSNATFVCTEGYYMVGRDYSVCAAQGWIVGVPKCQDVLCKRPTVTENMLISPTLETYKYKAVIELSCSPGHILVGRQYVWCNKDGVFTVCARCVKVTCPSMRTFSDVIGLSVDHRHYGAVQTYRCVHDLVTTTTICGLNSKWDPEPLCVPGKHAAELSTSRLPLAVSDMPSSAIERLHRIFAPPTAAAPHKPSAVNESLASSKAVRRRIVVPIIRGTVRVSKPKAHKPKSAAPSLARHHLVQTLCFLAVYLK